MPHQPDYSDSDDESIHEELETGVLLGLPDGIVTSKSDLFDPAVSRMGGLPLILTSDGFCTPDLLTINVHSITGHNALQIMSRANGTANPSLVVRAYRSVKFNARFAAKLERQKEKVKEKEEAKRRAAEEEAKKKASTAASSTVKPNPFSLSSAASGPSNPSFSSPFGSGNLFAAPSAPPPSSSKKADEEEEDEDDSDDDEPPATEEEINELAEALESTAIDKQSTAKSSANAAAWATAPSFKPLYLSSVSEYLVPEAKPKQLLKNVKVSDGLDDLDAAGGGGGGGGKWKTET
ncbi:hypothetical protein FS837_001683, partial [Tulasnella sp. UAMH 9824]